MTNRSVNRVFVGNLPLDCSESEVRREFERFGKITRIDLKRTSSGIQFAFIEFNDSRDAEDAISGRDGHDFKGSTLRVEIPFKDRGDRFNSRPYRGRGGPAQRGKYVVEVSGLPPSGSWQDLKDHLREAGQCGHADTYGNGTGEITFFSRSDMESALEKFNGSIFRSHEGEKSRITLREKPNSHYNSDRDYSRSRSPTYGRSRSPVYGRSRSPVYNRSRSPAYGKSRSRSPVYGKTRSPAYGKVKSSAHRTSRSSSYSRSRSSDYSKSRTPDNSRSRSSADSKSSSRHRSKSPTRVSRSPIYKDRSGRRTRGRHSSHDRDRHHRKNVSSSSSSPRPSHRKNRSESD